MDISSFKKILIIRLSSLGDILLTTPFIRTIKKKYPNIQIDFMVRKEFESTLVFNPHVNNLLSIPRDYNTKEYQNQIKLNQYGLIIDLQNNLRSRFLTRNSNARIVRYKKPYLKRLLLVKLKINKFKNIDQIPVRYANAIPNFILDDGGLELFLHPDLKPVLDRDSKYVGICPGSKHKTKMWPKEYFIQLCSKLISNNYRIVLFGGKDDMEICDEISKQVAGSINLSNDNKLLEFAVNIKNCNVIICNDSGLMHTSLAVDTPVISIFGSTVKEFGFFPYKGKSLVIENNSLSCRPCSHIGRDNCPKNHLNCMNDINPQFVLEKSLEFIKQL